MGDRENMIAERYLEYDDLNIYEKLTGNISMDIDILQNGN